MHNAFYRAIKGVDPGNVVVSAGTAPYGDSYLGARRLPPMRFWRDVFCLGYRQRCADPIRFDAIAHHPYSIRGPRRGALGHDNVAIADVWRLVRLLRAAERRGRVLPRGRKRVWITEISWDSSPPDPRGVPAARHARWLEESLYMLWKQGADTVLWYQVRDQLPEPSYAATNQSGIFLRDGRPKPARRAFRFPFVTYRTRRGDVRGWGRAPAPGPVWIERRAGRRWVQVARLVGGGSRVFTLRLGRAGGLFRARTPDETSLTWRQR
jgi:hypothetical protein